MSIVDTKPFTLLSVQHRSLVRLKMQEYTQDILNEEIAEFLGRGKSEPTTGIDMHRIYRNGMGKPRKLALMNGTVTVWPPRVKSI